MKEYFIIKTGTPDYDEDVDMMNIRYQAEQLPMILILVGGFLVVIALL
jgi:hypothetical protein